METIERLQTQGLFPVTLANRDCQTWILGNMNVFVGAQSVVVAMLVAPCLLHMRTNQGGLLVSSRQLKIV